MQALINQGLVIPNAVLIQNPFDKSLYHLKSEAMEQIALAKLLHFSTLCGHLGVREVETEYISIQEGKWKVNISVKGGVPVIADGSLGGRREGLNSFVQKLSSIHKFDGGEPNIQAAIEFLQRTGLSSETIMQDMLNKAQMHNKLKSSKINLILTTEGHQNLKVLASLNLKATRLPISLESNYNRKEYERTEYTLTIAVKF